MMPLQASNMTQIKPEWQDWTHTPSMFATTCYLLLLLNTNEARSIDMMLLQACNATVVISVDLMLLQA